MTRRYLHPATGFRFLLLTYVFGFPLSATAQVITPRLHHLRHGPDPEWTHFPKESDGASLHLKFDADAIGEDWTLRLRHQDVKQNWKVLINGKELMRLRQDENDMVVFTPLPRGLLKKGENTLAIEQFNKIKDDIRIGEIRIEPQPMSKVLNDATVKISVSEKGNPLPCRITVLNADGALMTVGAISNDHLAVRPGVIYAAAGSARFGLPAGEYTIIAGRGFEYGIASQRINVKAGESTALKLAIEREVPTRGYVSSDTHVHTLTFSGHGDADVHEQLIAIAGEGIELPIATDHNRQISYEAAAIKQKVRAYFTPVVGNEVTTSVGHFNIFPVKEGGTVPDYKLKEWEPIFASIQKTTNAKMIILNHARDLHSGFRPFGPERHIALTGEDLDGWTLKANGMEVVNSGAQQSDVMRLVHDWFGMLNRGFDITPVGASDSHDVARHFVGQGRTYIRCKDDVPGEIDVNEAVDNLRAGKVMVSCGLLAEMTINDKFGPGDLVPGSKTVKVALRVLGPSWVKADRIELFANGIKIKEEVIRDRSSKLGMLWEGVWNLPAFPHDVHLVAVASGPGVTDLFWPIARPYQPTSPVLTRRVIGISGAAWIDADGDGKKTSAFGYATRLMEKGKDAIPLLADHDEAVASQAASILQSRGISPIDAEILNLARKAGPHVTRGFEAFASAWRESQVARREASIKK